MTEDLVYHFFEYDANRNILKPREKVPYDDGGVYPMIDYYTLRERIEEVRSEGGNIDDLLEKLDR